MDLSRTNSQINPIFIYDSAKNLVDSEETDDVIELDFRKAFNTVSNDTFMS